MNAIPKNVLLIEARRALGAARELAASSRPGCRAARQQIKRAALHGLASRPYIFRDGMCYGWTESGVAPLFELVA